MFVKNEAKIFSRAGGDKWRTAYFGKLVFESDEQQFSLRGVKSKKISSKRKKRIKVSEKMENGLQRVDNEGGRWMLNTDIWEQVSWRVREDDSKEEKSGRQAGNCVKGSRMKKPVPLPKEELLPQCLHRTLSKV